MNKRLAIDFDRVLHDIDHPVEGRKMGPPMPRAIEAMNLLHRKGYYLIIFTLWATTPGGEKAVAAWLKYWQCPWDEITNIKPKADAYIDDKAIKHVDWKATIKEISEL
jgi:hypothetical protein